MRRATAVALLDRLHEAQNEFYGGGPGAALEQLLAPEITWTVPGDSRIAGICRGLEQVLDYFRLRRELSDRTFQMMKARRAVAARNTSAPITDRNAAPLVQRRHPGRYALFCDLGF
jgi:uncharacterized protein